MTQPVREIGEAVGALLVLLWIGAVFAPRRQERFTLADILANGFRRLSRFALWRARGWERAAMVVEAVAKVFQREVQLPVKKVTKAEAAKVAEPQQQTTAVRRVEA